MLDTLDILIGFTLIMLIVSMPVTLLTQTAIELANLRGAALHRGLASLLGLLARGTGTAFTKDDQKRLANLIQTDDLVGRRTPLHALFGTRSRAGVIHREELAKLLLALAQPQQPDTPAGKLAAILKELGVENPGNFLKKVRMAQLEAEKASPELAADIRANLALLEQPKSDFLARLYAWFDQTMDRVSELFTLYARFITALVALLVAVALQLDAVGLINRLSDDKVVRKALVELAIKDPERFSPATADQVKAAQAAVAEADRALKAARDKLEEAGGDEMAERAAVDRATFAKEAAERRKALLDARDRAARDAETVVRARNALEAAADPAVSDASRAALEKAEADAATSRQEAAALASAPGMAAEILTEDPAVQELVRLDLVTLPGADWAERAKSADWLGILLSACLLSLGGPFWYALLQNLIKLRPTILQRDEEQRALRQTTQTDDLAQKPGVGAAQKAIRAAG